jgi:acyl-CoA hydrolase
MKFRAPVKVGDVITLRATVNAAWRTAGATTTMTGR